MNVQFCTANELANITSLSPSTCKQYRLKGLWVQGIHWQKMTERSVLYNLPLILDWIANRSQPDAHQRAIDAYRASLPSAVTSEPRQSKRGKVA